MTLGQKQSIRFEGCNAVPAAVLTAAHKCSCHGYLPSTQGKAAHYACSTQGIVRAWHQLALVEVLVVFQSPQKMGACTIRMEQPFALPDMQSPAACFVIV